MRTYNDFVGGPNFTNFFGRTGKVL